MDHAITSATREILAERGYAGLTVDAVATRAGIGKAAIYRRFATKQEMIFSVVIHDMRETAPPDTGSLRTDLAALARTVAGQLSSAPTDVLTGLLADIYADSTLAERFSGTFLERQRQVITELLERAGARGELASRPDPATVHALVLGPIFVWLLVLDGDPGTVDGLIETVAESATAALLSAAAHSCGPSAGGSMGVSSPRGGAGGVGGAGL
ncbi:TetR/AcrR family transcriptional regulator [Nocardia sp. 2]|uniref:TetR/AcrR family transcriptional regulator n=1 Tax=Nocardia acididurans TaxID=2802282 RepID=A0ABS1LYZ1_9NOCA|nr:TetR/AcrR family transcriptional regulator [Nocardia acididurans]MBL1072990.1 TetR/AcrR family transcriptional regulator [Nocardia acididurans]